MNHQIINMTYKLNYDETLLPENGEDMKISRGVRLEPKIDFQKIKNLFLFDEHGIKIKFIDVFSLQKTIVIFTRVCGLRSCLLLLL